MINPVHDENVKQRQIHPQGKHETACKLNFIKVKIAASLRETLNRNLERLSYSSLPFGLSSSSGCRALLS